ncbi:ABC transporter substrate-binding protein [Amycolatopsis magusensis]|uniref:ABC transporter substrate-binding protein n=1 Tax=Amycolatopsis magusensis TaxID=882444 RepID=UPI003C2F35EC
MPIALTRRGFLGFSAGAALVLGGCGGADGAGDGAGGEPKRGGRLRALFTGGGTKETLDPHAQNLFIDQARHKAIFDKLTELGDDLAPVPRLAERWEANADATLWRFTLRQARFHDGQPLTGEDVLFSLARILDPAAGDRLARQSLSAIDLGRSRVVDPRTVEIAVTTPSAELPALLATTGAAIVRAGYADPAKPVGTGPFRFVSFDPGRSLIAQRFDEHWEGAPHLDELHILSADADARANALQGGQAEYAHEMSPTFARTAEAGRTVKIVAAPGSTTQAFVLKTDRPPFDNPGVALAFKLLADRPRLVEVVLGGRGVPGNDLFGKGYRYYHDALPQRPRDVAEARSLLTKAGVLNQTIQFFTSTVSAGFVDAATLFAEQAGEAGIRVEVVTGAAETYFKDQLTTGVLGSHRAGAAPIPDYINSRLLSTSPFNATAWKRPEFDAAFATAQSTVDEAGRTRLYHDLQRDLHDRGGLLAWGHPDWINAVAANVHGVQAVPPNTVNWARFDKVWLG